MREDPVDKVEIHPFRGVSGRISWLACQSRPDVSCQVSHLQQILHQPTVAIMLLLHVDASLNTGGLLGSRGGYIFGVTDQSVLERRNAPCSPLAKRSFTISRTVPSSSGAEAQPMSVALGFVE